MKSRQEPLAAAPTLTAWKILAKESLLTAPPWLEVFREQVQLPGGRIIDDFYRVVLPQFAMVAPITPAGEFVMVRGYKHGLKRINLSPPAGLLEPGEQPLAAARRELLEETGYVANDWIPLGAYVVDGNRQCGTMHLFCARGARPLQRPRTDELEELNLELLSLEQLKHALRRGEIGNLAGAGGVALALLLAM